jgi:hypothetical protein
MPLSAYVNEEYVYGPDIPDAQWAAIRRDRSCRIALPCGRPGFLRVSPKGTKHFVHRTNHDDCPWAHESADHVDAKRTLVDELRESGWTIRTEECGPDWRADVLATSPNQSRRVAFEVQLSPQSYDETVIRQQRFMSAGVEGVWLFRTMPRFGVDPLIPMFSLARDDEDAWRVTLRRGDPMSPRLQWYEHEPPGTMALGDFARAWLSSQVGLRPRICLDSEWPSRIEVFRTACAVCGHENLLYAASAPRISRCGVLASELATPSNHPTKYLMHLRAYGPFGVRTRAMLRRFFDAPGAPRVEGEPVSIRCLYRPLERVHRFVCQWCPHIYSGREYAAVAKSSPRVALIDWPVPFPGVAAEQNIGERDAGFPHWCLAGTGADCTSLRTAIGATPESSLYADSDARRAEMAALPVHEFSRVVAACFRRDGWRFTETHWETDAPFHVFESDTRKVLALIGTADWSAEGIEQFFQDADEQDYQLIWFTVDQELAKLPALAGRLLIPVRAEREDDSSWQFFVVLGPSEEQPLVWAMRALTLMCASDPAARGAS